MARAVIALGSNLGDREAMLDFAVSALSALPKTKVLQEAQRRETEPVDVPAGYEDLRFLNSAILIETALPPLDLLHRLLAIEAEAGRVRVLRNGPRPLDLDIILYEGMTSNTPELTLPHPRAAARAFVLAPLADLGIRAEDVRANAFGAARGKRG